MFTKNALTTVLALTAALALAGNSAQLLQADLTGAGKGKVKWKTKQIGNRVEGQLEGSGERLAPLKDYKVFIGTNAPIGVRTDAIGTYRFSLRYVAGPLPSIKAGDKVDVVNAANVVALSGTFTPR